MKSESFSCWVYTFPSNFFLPLFFVSHHSIYSVMKKRLLKCDEWVWDFLTTSERDRNLIKILCERHTFCLVAPMGIKHVLILAFPTIILHNSGNTYLLVCPSFFTFIQGLPTKKNVLLHSLPQRDYKIALVCGFCLPARIFFFFKLSTCAYENETFNLPSSPFFHQNGRTKMRGEERKYI